MAYSRGALLAAAIGCALWFVARAAAPARRDRAARRRRGRRGDDRRLGVRPGRADDRPRAARRARRRRRASCSSSSLAVLLARSTSPASSRASSPTRSRCATTSRRRAGHRAARRARARARRRGAARWRTTDDGLGGSIDNAWTSLTDTSAVGPANDPSRLTATGSVRSRYWDEAFQMWERRAGHRRRRRRLRDRAAALPRRTCSTSATRTATCPRRWPSSGLLGLAHQPRAARRVAPRRAHRDPPRARAGAGRAWSRSPRSPSSSARTRSIDWTWSIPGTAVVGARRRRLGRRPRAGAGAGPRRADRWRDRAAPRRPRSAVVVLRARRRVDGVAAAARARRGRRRARRARRAATSTQAREPRRDAPATSTRCRSSRCFDLAAIEQTAGDTRGRRARARGGRRAAARQLAAVDAPDRLPPVRRRTTRRARWRRSASRSTSTRARGTSHSATSTCRRRLRGRVTRALARRARRARCRRSPPPAAASARPGVDVPGRQPARLRHAGRRSPSDARRAARRSASTASASRSSGARSRRPTSRTPARASTRPTRRVPGEARGTRYDRVVRLARERGIGVNFNITAPAPDWATGNARARGHRRRPTSPTRRSSARFVTRRRHALRRRARPGARRLLVDQERAQPGRLADAAVGASATAAGSRPRRGSTATLVDAAWTRAAGRPATATTRSSSARPRRRACRTNRGETRSIDALRFIRRLYCLDDNLQVLARRARPRRTAARPSDQIAALPRASTPALFRDDRLRAPPLRAACFAPDRRPTWPRLGDDGRTSTTCRRCLRRIRARYGQPRGARCRST